MLLLLLLQATVLHLALLRTWVTSSRLGMSILRVVSRRIRSLIMRLAIVLMLRLVLLRVVVPLRRMSPTLQIDVHPPLVLLGVVLQVQLPANLLDLRLDLLDMARAVVAFADDDVKMALSGLPRVANALLENLLGFFDILAV